MYCCTQPCHATHVRHCWHTSAGISEQAEALADHAVSQFNHIVLWVNNAGASQPTKGDLVDSDAAVMQASCCMNNARVMCCRPCWRSVPKVKAPV